jgi:MFS family permease
VQRLTPRHLLGRTFGVVATAAQLGSAVAYAVAGPLITGLGPRGAFLVAGAGTVLALLVVIPALRAASADALEGSLPAGGGDGT